MAFDIVSRDKLAGRRVFRVVEPGIPDGFVVDRRGWIWTTSGSGIQIFDEAATKLGEIPTPTRCASCAFGHHDGRRLFIAAERFLLAVDLLG